MDQQKINELEQLINSIPDKKAIFRSDARRELKLAISNPDKWAVKCEKSIRKLVAEALWQTERGY